MQRIESDPIFQVVTLDKQTWIDPYSGEAVSVGDDLHDSIVQHLNESNVATDQETLPLQQLLAIRWRHDLLRILPHEPRLRIFGADGEGWLNPFSGEFESKLSREDGRITMRTVVAMAEALARCPYARNGIMLDSETLQERVKALTRDRMADSGSFALSEDLKQAKSVQEHMLSDLPDVPGYEIGLHYEPHSGVSGDFYEIMPLPGGRYLLLLGDVSGHGMQAALVVATALKTLRLLARQTQDLSGLLGQLNDEIADDLLPGQFITVFAGIFDPQANSLSCVLAGHHPMLVVNPVKTQLLRQVGRPGMAMGLVNGQIFRNSLRVEELTLDPGDMLLQYTDGLVEAMDKDSEEFGLHRVCGYLLLCHGSSAQECIDAIAEEVRGFVDGPLDDDLTLVSLARLPDDDGDD